MGDSYRIVLFNANYLIFFVIAMTLKGNYPRILIANLALKKVLQKGNATFERLQTLN